MNIIMQNITKSFHVNKVLSNVDFELKHGEILALMGENGAGKSTLMKILTGVYQKDSGKIFVDDKEVIFHNPKEAELNGISFIHQELNVLYDLTVEENLFIGKELETFGWCNKKKMLEESITILSILDVNISPNMRMSSLSIGQQQMVEICKALMNNTKIIIMDEPTAALTDKETKALFRVISRLKDQEVSIIYISHRMEEIFEISDRIMVMRDGCNIGIRNTAETTMGEIVKMMIGREINDRFPKRESQIGEKILEVQGLTAHGFFKDVSFHVSQGEILGIGGLMGAGRTEIVRALFGNLPYDQGNIYINGFLRKIHSPQDAINHKIGFITEDRKMEGLLLEKSIRENISLSNLSFISHCGVINSKQENQLANTAISDFHIKSFNQDTLTINLSGGNQQKVVLAKWILKNPVILILDEPTRGVDIGAKKEIYMIMNKLASQGVAIIMVSSELPELLGMSDRIAVVHEGKIAGILEKEQYSQENIMILATGGGIYAK
ncbi:MAG: sugar ABC transporter ATP-binding protein [Brevinema sp.]